MTEKKSKKNASVEHPNSNAPPQEVIVHLPLSDLHPFPENPYAMRDDPAMQATADSIKSYGVLTPAIVRPIADGGYEIISGHRRKHGCELAGLDTMPCIVRNLDDDEAIIQLVDSNAQREDVLPSERAKAYKMRYLIPDLTLREQEQQPLGKYGRMRKNYLKEHRPVLWNNLILSEKLYSHLREIDEAATRRMEQMMPELAAAAGATEALKASDPMRWTGLMNNCKTQAEETVLNELVYA